MQTKIKIINEVLNIQISLTHLKKGIEQHPEITFKVKDKKAMANFYKNMLFEFTSDYGDTPDFWRVFDKIAIEAYESAEDWIENKEEND